MFDLRTRGPRTGTSRVVWVRGPLARKIVMPSRLC